MKEKSDAMMDRILETPFLLNALASGSGIAGELNDLFYFFKGSKGFYKSYFRTPELKPDHDEKLKTILDAMKGVDLRTLEEIESYDKIQNNADFYYPLLSERKTRNNMDILRYSEITNKTLGGELEESDFSELTRENLEPYLKMMTMRIRINATTDLVCSYLMYNMLPKNIIVSATIIGFLGGSLGISIISGPKIYPLPAYNILMKKAKRQDALMEEALYNHSTAEVAYK